MKDDHSPASPDRRPANAQELENWFLGQNLFGPGAMLSDVARHFDRSLDHVKRLSAKYRWQALLVGTGWSAPVSTRWARRRRPP